VKISVTEWFSMKLPDEPKGWRRLRAMAQRAPDTHSLALIIEQLNRLLDEHEKKMKNQSYVRNSQLGTPALSLEVQPQYD
jgi:hypothetical protein